MSKRSLLNIRHRLPLPSAGGQLATALQAALPSPVRWAMATAPCSALLAIPGSALNPQPVRGEASCPPSPRACEVVLSLSTVPASGNHQLACLAHLPHFALPCPSACQSVQVSGINNNSGGMKVEPVHV